MATVSIAPARPRLFLELVLMGLALLVGIAGYALTSLNYTGAIPANLLTQVGVLLALAVIGLGLAAALLGHGLYSHEPAAAINLPSAGILLFVVVTAYRRRRPEAQPVLVSTQEAPLAEIGANLPQ